MSERQPYSRVYWSITDDEKFAACGAYDDDRMLAAWLRLLLVADQAHPASAHLPATLRRSVKTRLAEAGIIDLLPGGRYRVHGLDAERERRRLAATRIPTASQGGPKGDPNGPEVPVLSLAEPSRDETSLAEPITGDDDLWALYRGLTRVASLKPAAIDWLTRIEERYGLVAAATALRAEHVANPSPGTLLSRTEARCERVARAADSAAEHQKRNDRVVADMERRRVEAFRNGGKWAPEWGPEPVVGLA